MRSYGWRARIGHIYPAVVAETFMCEFYRIVPPGVTLAQTNLVIQSLNEREGLEASIKRIDEAAEDDGSGVESALGSSFYSTGTGHESRPCILYRRL